MPLLGRKDRYVRLAGIIFSANKRYDIRSHGYSKSAIANIIRSYSKIVHADSGDLALLHCSLLYVSHILAFYCSCGRWCSHRRSGR